MSLLTEASLIVTPNAYKAGTLYSVIPNTTLGDMTVVRATSATRVNSAGLIEIARTNLATYSEDFSNIIWSKVATTITTDSVNAPDGTLTADTFIANGTTSPKLITGVFAVILGTTYSISVFVKKNTNNFVQLIGAVGTFGANFWANFDLNNGVVGTIGSSATATITDFGNGWYRCVIVGTATASSTPAFNIGLINSATSVRAEVNTLSTSAYLWGAQLEVGSVATEYIPTVASIRTKFAGITQDGSSASNIPRIDYTGGGCPSILVEPQRTNVIQNSNAISAHFFSGVAVINAVTSPEGITNAFSFDVNNNTQGGLSPITLTTSAQSYTFSVYLKGTVNSQKVKLYGDLNGTIQEFTLTTSWERYTKTFTGAVGGQSIYLLNGSYFSPAQNDLYYGYGLQLEVGAYATSLIPTTAATATRNADEISKTGISSLIGQTEGTLYAEFNNTLMTSYSAGYVMRIFADANNEVWIRKEGSSNTYTARWRANSTNVYTQLNIAVLNGNNKIAIAYKSTDSAVYLNGTQIGTSASTGAFSVAPSQIAIGSSSTIDFFNDRIELATLFQTRLTNDQCILLTGPSFSSYPEMASALIYTLQ